jgi:hypothetical protein
VRHPRRGRDVRQRGILDMGLSKSRHPLIHPRHRHQPQSKNRDIAPSTKASWSDNQRRDRGHPQEQTSEAPERIGILGHRETFMDMETER